MNITLYFGDNDVSISGRAKLKNLKASLLDHSNYKEFLANVNSGVYYTSLADLPKDLNIILDILSKAELIVYCLPESWSDGKSCTIANRNNSIQELTESLLLYVSVFKKVDNIESCLFDENYMKNSLPDVRKQSNRQLWIAGCSISHGVGVSNEQTYGHLLSKHLNLPCSFLTAPGASIKWTANQILKSDLKSGDVLCWGITSPARLPFFYQGKLYHITGTSYQYNKNLHKVLPIDLLDNENQFYDTVESIRTVNNFCQKLEVKLIMFNILNDDILNKLLRREKNYYQFNYPLNKNYHTYTSHGLHQFYDLGTDNIHPGPITHQKYSNFLAQLINDLAV